MATKMFPTMPPALPRYKMVTVKPSTLRTLLRRTKRSVKALFVAGCILRDAEVALMMGEVERAGFHLCDLKTHLETWLADTESMEEMVRVRVKLAEKLDD